MEHTSPDSDTPSTPAAGSGLSIQRECARVGAWIGKNPVSALLIAIGLGAVIYFYGLHRVFLGGTQSTLEWTLKGWNEENDQQHCFLLPPLILWLFWRERERLFHTPAQPEDRGIGFVIVGVILFVISVRLIQARVAILSFPLLVYGTALYLGGKEKGRAVAFPCFLMLFAIPIGGVVQSTVSLQLIAAKVVGIMCALTGIHPQIQGTQFTVDGHPFEVAGGCSGIRSLMAMVMLAAVYVHFFEKGFWKQATIFCASIVFALIGNIIRLYVLILAAKFIGADFAGGPFHDYSGFIFFPVAVMSMLGFANFLNRDWRPTLQTVKAITNTQAAPEATESVKDGISAQVGTKSAPAKNSSPISYDY